MCRRHQHSNCAEYGQAKRNADVVLEPAFASIVIHHMDNDQPCRRSCEKAEGSSFGSRAARLYCGIGRYEHGRTSNGFWEV
jgi:hypothetical protein